MDIATIKKCLTRYPVSRAILFSGAHGLGKSSFWKQVSCERNQTYLDIRLGQMTEGDLLGLYEIIDGRTANFPPSWYLKACEEPCVLHFDELNRALPNVVQGVFQIILDRCLGEFKLHEGTQVAASINTGESYDVIELDPALLDRFAQIEFAPTKSEFLVWAEKNIHPKVVDFLSVNHSHIESHCVPGKVMPSRRSWEFLSQDLYDDLENSNYSLVYPIAQTEVGTEAASAFIKYLKEIKVISQFDILNSYKSGMMDGLSESEYARLSDSVTSYLIDSKKISAKHKANYVKFVNELPDEFVASCWRKINKHSLAQKIGALISDSLERAL